MATGICLRKLQLFCQNGEPVELKNDALNQKINNSTH
jgi:hypothetical protein